MGLAKNAIAKTSAMVTYRSKKGPTDTKRLTYKSQHNVCNAEGAPAARRSAYTIRSTPRGDAQSIKYSFIISSDLRLLCKKSRYFATFSAPALSDDLGYIIKWEYQCPGVFYVANEGEGRIAGEYYIVEQNSLYISAATKT